MQTRRNGTGSYIEVGMQEWAKGSSDSLLETFNLGPCTGLAIYNPATAVGHLAHLVLPHVERDLVEPLLKSVLTDTTDPSSLQSWLRGSAPDAHDPAELVAMGLKSREYISRVLRSAGIVQ